MLKTHTPSPRTRAAGTTLALALLAALVGCGAAPQAPGAAAGTPAAPGAPTAYPAPAVAATAYPEPLGGAASTAMPAPTRPPLSATADLAGMTFGAVPAELAAVAVADLVQRASVAATAISVVSAEAVEWPDGAVGCPKPDTMYPQVITPGFKLVLAVSGQQYTYHASESGQFFLCENKAP